MAERTAGRPALGLPAAIVWPLVIMGALALLWSAYFLGRRGVSIHPFSTGPRIEDVRKIAKLAVLRVQVADVIEGNTMGAKAVVLVSGDADIAIDLDQIQIADRDERQHTARLVVPKPQPDRPRVDHNRTRIYELRKTGLAAINPFADPRADLLLDSMRAAQEDVERAVQAAEFVAKAKEQTEFLLLTFYKGLGWDVTIQWK